MAAGPKFSNSLVSVLESDLRQLSHDARKTEGFASFFGSSDNAPEVKEAAERAVLKLRGLSDNPTALDQLRSTTDVLRPLQLACDTKSARLICQALSTVQKLVSNHAMAPDATQTVVDMLARVERLMDEGVQLKSLQTALTLLQSPLHPSSEEEIATVLGICFRAMNPKGRKDTVASTAAATVRQAVALVFSYVNVPEELVRLERRRRDELEQAAAKVAGVATPHAPSPFFAESGAAQDTAPTPELIAAQRLLEDLIAIATGAPPTWLKTSSLPRTFVLEVLDFALDQTSELFTALPEFESTLSLRISQLLQAQLADYLDAGAAGAPLATTTASAFRATLRCVRTVLLRYHVQLAGRAGTLVQTLLRGLNPPHPLSQRIAVAQLVRHLLADPALVLHLFLTFDSHRDRKLDAVHALVRAAADVVDDALKPGLAGDGDGSAGGGGATGAAGRRGKAALEGIEPFSGPVEAVDALFQARSRGATWTMDSDYESASQETQKAYLAMLGTDSLLLFAAAVERLTDAAMSEQYSRATTIGNRPTLQIVEERVAASAAASDVSRGPSLLLPPSASEMDSSLHMEIKLGSGRLLSSAPTSPSKQMRQRRRSTEIGAGEPPPAVDKTACAALVMGTWRAVLAVLSQLLARCNREILVLSVLKGYQGFTQSCGVLELDEPRDAFLGTLCELALSGNDAGVLDTLGIVPFSLAERTGSSEGSGADSPRYPSGGGGGTASPKRSMSTDYDADAGLVLTSKNIQAMRTLFNISYRLSNMLGPAWVLVLETLNTLDKVLQSPKTTTQETSAPSASALSGAGAGGGEGQADGGGAPSDLAILAAAAAQLFEGTKDMSDEAVIALLSGLRDVSLRNLPIAAQVSQPKLFALDRMVEVLLVNTSRLPDLWAIFLAHVLEVIADPKPPVRIAAIAALGRAIVGALGAATDPDPLQHPGLADAAGLEHMLLVALESIYNDHHEPEVRAGVLRVLLSVLQRHGERLTEAWTAVFRLLAVVPTHGVSETVSLGFEALQLICSDYLAAMPFERLKRCLEVAVSYGNQQADLNVSLTAISLLWNVADTLGRSGTGVPEDGVNGEEEHQQLPGKAATHTSDKPTNSVGARDSSAPPTRTLTTTPASTSSDTLATTRQARSALAAASTPAQTEELLRLIFSALQSLSRDPRPEVRNSGARTLFAVVVTQGPRLSRRLWELCLWEMLFPLLRHAFHMSATSSREETEAALLGRAGGEQVRLVVHHSRNTEQKQWDETTVVAVGGMTRLLRAHLPAIAAMEGLEGGWDELMVVAESSLAGGRKEVALAAVGLLSGVLCAHGGDDTVVNNAMWRRALRALDVGVEAATSAGCQVPLAARTEMVALVGSLYSSLRSRFDEEATAAAFRWTEGFCRNPWSEGDASNPVQAIGMPPVQKAALGLLPRLKPDHIPRLWPSYLRTMSRLLQPAHVVAFWQQEKEALAAQERRDGEAAAAREDTNGRKSGGGAGKTGKKAGPSTGAFEKENNATPAPASRQQGLGATPGPLGTGASAVAHVPAKEAQHRFALNASFLEKMLEVVVAAYAEAPPSVRVETLADVVEALDRCMELRFTVYPENLWRASAKAFNRLLPSGLSALATVSEAVTAARAWTALAEAFEDFLLGQRYLSLRQGSTPHAAGQAGLESHHRRATESTKDGDLPVVPILELPSKRAATTAAVSAASLGQKGRGRKDAAGGSTSIAAHSTAHPSVEQDALGLGTLVSQFDGVVIDPQQARSDAELELAVLDSLTDVVLVHSGPAPRHLVSRLISVVDRGVSRPRGISIPQTLTGSNFSHVCLRKMYVMCSRVAGPEDAATLEVARLSLPPFLGRCDAVLRGFAEDARPGALGDDLGPAVPRPRLDEVMCVLEVLASMSIVPAVADAALPPGEAISEVVRSLRKRPEAAARGRERSHLLLLYSALCGCITCKEPRVREMVGGVLGLAGAELGLGTPLQVLIKGSVGGGSGVS